MAGDRCRVSLDTQKLRRLVVKHSVEHVWPQYRNLQDGPANAYNHVPKISLADALAIRRDIQSWGNLT